MKMPIRLSVQDMETHFNKMIPENMPYYEHDTEGADDMPAHLKSAIIETAFQSQ